ncbi:MAG: MOFRL family protein [Burkholderiales bacterium]
MRQERRGAGERRDRRGAAVRGRGAAVGRHRGARSALCLAVVDSSTVVCPRRHALAADTDGIDGSEDNAGAYLAPDSLPRERPARSPLLARRGHPPSRASYPSSPPFPSTMRNMSIGIGKTIVKVLSPAIWVRVCR